MRLCRLLGVCQQRECKHNLLKMAASRLRPQSLVFRLSIPCKAVAAEDKKETETGATEDRGGCITTMSYYDDDDENSSTATA
jgi:hypothetical protein